MAHLPHIAALLFSTPLLVHEGKLRAIVAGLGPRFGLKAPAAFDEDYDRPRPERRPYRVTSSGIAVVPVVGILANRSGSVDATSSPMVGYDGVLSSVGAAMGDPSVRGVVMDIESPGGEAFGCFDASASLAALRGNKPLIASANAYAYSAAYSLASAADQIFVPRSGEVGSIGVVAAHVDQSGADAQAGLAFEYVYAGDHKVDGNSHEPLSDAARGEMQARVTDLYEMFVSSVAGNRRMDAAKIRATQARCLGAQEAIDAGIADRIGTLADAIREAESRTSSTRPTRGRISTTSTKGSRMNDESDLAAAAREAVAAEAAREAALVAARAEAAAAATAHAAGIVEMCATYGRPQDAAKHIASGASRGQVAEALLQAKAAEQAPLSAMHPVGATAPVNPADPDGWLASTARVCRTVKGA